LNIVLNLIIINLEETMSSNVNVLNAAADKSNNINDYHQNDDEVRIPLNSNIKNMELYEVS
jgi:hypothetical protein